MTVNMSADKDQKELLEAPPRGVAKALICVDDWCFDTFALAEACNNKPIKYLGHYLFNRYGIMKKYQIKPIVLENFLNRLESGYNTHNPKFHGNVHAADVTQTMHYMIHKTGLEKSLQDVEIFTSLLAAMIHNYEHRAKTNSFLIATRDDLALVYNDRSVQQNFHVSAVFFMLKDPNCNILSNLSKQQFHQLRTLIIEMVLCTDMVYHFHLLKNIKARLSSLDGSEERAKFLSFILHAADMSHLCKTWSLHERWTSLLYEELFAQGDLERSMGLRVGALRDRYNTPVPEAQIHFLDFFVEPVLTVLGDVLDSLDDNQDGTGGKNKTPVEKPWNPYLMDNKKNWKDKCAKSTN